MSGLRESFENMLYLTYLFSNANLIEIISKISVAISVVKLL